MMGAKDHVKYVLAWYAWCSVVCLGLVALDNWASVGFGPRLWTELFYDASIALGAALLVWLPWAVSYGLELGTRPSRRGLVAVLLLLAIWPGVWDVAGQVAAGEGISAIAIKPTHARIAISTLLLAGTFFVWLYQRSPTRASWHLPLGLLATAALFAFEQRFLRTYGMLAPFVLVAMIVCASSAVARAMFVRPALYHRGALAIALLLGGLLLAGLARPRLLSSGRRSVLADETAALYLDPFLFAAELRNVRFDVSRPERFRCDQSARVQPWPKLALSDSARRNVILISVDALRADVVGSSKLGRPLTPNLQRLALESRVAEHAYTTYPATLFAVSGAMNGLLPSEILFAPEPPASLFRTLRKKVDYAIAVLPTVDWFVQPAFARYVLQGAPRRNRRDARDQTDEMIRVLSRARAAKQRVFAWVHYFEPHQPYVSHKDFDFGPAPADLYHSEVAAFDRELGRLLHALKSNGWYDDSLIVFFSDHGQALGERGYLGHHVFLNRWLVDIPFMMHVPNTPPTPIRGPVQITDVAATALHFLDATPEHVLSGQSLLMGDPPTTREIISEAFPLRGMALFNFANQPLTSTRALEQRIELIQHDDRRYQPKVSLVRGHDRLIVRRTTATTELYDTRERRETRELTAHKAKVVDDMLAAMGAWHRRASERFYCDLKRLEQSSRPAVLAPNTPAQSSPATITEPVGPALLPPTTKVGAPK